ncbi:MAG: thioester reductase domain-containing protein [Cyanobacteriota bacterium]
MIVNTLKDLLQSKLEYFSDRNAFSILENENTTTNLSYKMVDSLSIKMSSVLNSKTNFLDRAIIILPPGEKYITTLYSCFYSGIIAVPVYPPNPASIEQSIGLISSIGIDSESKLIITNSQIKNVLFSVKEKFPYFNEVTWHLVDEDLGSEFENSKVRNITNDTLALLLYTSGSTGTPKGVMLSHGNLIHNAKIMSEGCKLNSDSKFCIWLPPYHVSGLFSGLILPVYSGATNILFSPLQFVENPFKWLKTISENKITLSGSPTFAYDICNKVIPDEKLKEIDLSSWKSAVVGGEAIKKDVIEKFIKKFSIAGFSKTTFYTMFGLTESTMISTGRGHEIPEYKYISRKKLEDNIAFEMEEFEENGMYLTCSGLALNEMNVLTVDPETKIPCKDNIVGEIWVSGKSIAKGYWKKPDETEKTFNAYTVETNSKGPFLRTGDFGFISEGKLFVTGRMKEVIIVRGVNHYPEDIERTVKMFFKDNEIECAIFQTEINNNEELVIALELAPNLKNEEANTISIIKKQVAMNHGLTPYAFVVLSPNELPRTVTRKIQRKQCGKNVFENKWNLLYILNNDNEDIIKNNTTEVFSLDINSEKKEISKYLKYLFANKLNTDKDKISEDIILSSFGLDSILTVNIISEIRNNLNVNVPISKFFDETSIKTLSDFIFNLLTGVEEIDQEIDFVQEYMLPNEINGKYNFEFESFNYQNIFLTGATGFLGGYLLNDLLINTTSTIYCLVRAKNKQEGLNRLKQNIEKNHKIPDSFEERVIPILGDLTTKNLGLEKTEFDYLSEKIDIICHNGASVNFIAPYQSIKSANVDSTKILLSLAIKNKIKPLHFVSTLAVFNSSDRNTYEAFYENMINPHPENIFGGYPKSKYISEMLLLEAKKCGLPITIYRPGLITGDSHTGYTNIDDFYCRLIKGCIELEAFPDINFDLDMTPVNYVSNVITLALTKKEAINKIFHLANPEPIKFSNFSNWIIENGYKAKIVSYENWLEKLISSSTNNALYPLLPFVSEKHTPNKITFLEMFNSPKSPKFDTTNVSNLLKESKIRCHSANDSLLNCYFKFFNDTQFLKFI